MDFDTDVTTTAPATRSIAMTQKKRRIIRPHTGNIVAAGLGGYEPILQKVVEKYIDDDVAGVIDQVNWAVTRYFIAVRSNPIRRVRRNEEDDQHELVESIKEVTIRLNFEVHIPPILMDAARKAYVAHPGGEASLDDEIRHLSPRLRHVGSLFESISIPYKSTTNPGKVEVRVLSADLGSIFDRATEGQYTQKRERSVDRKRFIRDAIEAFPFKLTARKSRRQKVDPSGDVALTAFGRYATSAVQKQGGNMARKPQVAVEPRADGRWAVQTNGTQRADSLHDRKADAVKRGRELAENKRTELVIKNEAGRIKAKDSHGKDPRRIKG